MRAPNAGRVMKVYRAATPEQVDAGLGWYRAAHAAAAGLDPGNVRRAAGVIAALSPRVAWERNLDLAEDAYEAWERNTNGAAELCVRRYNVVAREGLS